MPEPKNVDEIFHDFIVEINDCVGKHYINNAIVRAKQDLRKVIEDKLPIRKLCYQHGILDISICLNCVEAQMFNQAIDEIRQKLKQLFGNEA